MGRLPGMCMSQGKPAWMTPDYASDRAAGCPTYESDGRNLKEVSLLGRTVKEAILPNDLLMPEVSQLELLDLGGIQVEICRIPCKNLRQR